jgi:hypothetical protein
MIMSSPFSGGGRPALIISFPFLGGGHRAMIPRKSKCHLDDDEMTTTKRRGRNDGNETTATKRRRRNDGDETTATKQRRRNSRRRYIVSPRASPQRATTSPPTHITTCAFRGQREEGGAAVLFPGQVYKTHPSRNDSVVSYTGDSQVDHRKFLRTNLRWAMSSQNCSQSSFWQL